MITSARKILDRSHPIIVRHFGLVTTFMRRNTIVTSYVDTIVSYMRPLVVGTPRVDTRVVTHPGIDDRRSGLPEPGD